MINHFRQRQILKQIYSKCKSYYNRRVPLQEDALRAICEIINPKDFRKVKKVHKNIVLRKKWTQREVRQLRQMLKLNQNTYEIAKTLGRTINSVTSKMHSLGLKTQGGRK